VVRLHPSTLTGVVQRLVRKQLLIRERDAADSRYVRLRVAARAGRFIHRRTGTVEAAVGSALRRVRAADVRRAREVLRAIAEALEHSSGR
jgi:DNA-binding MarR family transcriptional regulator